MSDEVRTVLRRARAERAAGRVQAALAEAKHARALARGSTEPLAVLQELGYCLQEAGEHDEAIDVLQAAFFRARAAGAEDAADIALRVARVLAAEEQPEPAMAWIRHAEAEIERSSYDPAVAHRLLTARGGVHMAGHDFDAARVEFGAAVELARATWGERDGRVGTALHDEGVALVEAGRIAEAREIYERAIEIKREAYGPEHPQLVDTMSMLANTFLYDGQYEEALRRLEVVHRMQVVALGPTHRRVAGVVSNMAVGLLRLGRVEEAHARLAEAVGILEHAPGSEGPLLALMLGNLGSVARELGRTDEARAHYERAVAIAERSGGAEDARVVQPLLNLGNLLAENGEFEPALGHYMRALEVGLERLGQRHPFVAQTQTATAIVLLELERASEAVALLEQALPVRTSPERAPLDRAEVRYHLARALWIAGGDRNRARELAEAAQADLAAAEQPPDDLRNGIEAWLAVYGAAARPGRGPVAGE
jgi:tetratricopeptide (TPR) repeat protein